jgi:hypothetical protein
MLFLSALLITLFHLVSADFIYTDFNQTLGLNFNGDAATSGCEIKETYVTRNNVETLRKINSSSVERGSNQTIVAVGKGNDLQSMETTVTNEHDNGNDSQTNDMEAQFGHRDTYKPSPKTGCKRRLRLTPSSPSTAGSVFFEKRLPVVSLSIKSILH